MNLRRTILLMSLSFAILFIASCSKDKDDNPSPQNPSSEVIVKNLPADPAHRDPNDGSSVIDGDNEFTLFRFSDSTVVPNSDSASAKWDIGFRGTEIILNGGVSGPGEASGQVLKTLFQDVEKAPGEGYKADGSEGHVFSEWYNYNMNNHIISPVAGYIMIIRTNDNKYVKMEILNYYKDAPAQPDSEDESRFYTFRYVIQPDGSSDFKTKQ